MTASPPKGSPGGVPTQGAVLVIAEKPAVARDIAAVVGAHQRSNGYLHGHSYLVTWAIGHLVALAEPHEIHPEWRRWTRATLPMLPTSWPLVVLQSTKEQFEVVKGLLSSPGVERVICATDAGREGELIFRYLYEAAGSKKPFQRLWISSLTEDAIAKGLRALRDGREFDALADAARGRSRADWLVGMNLSRACTLAYDENLSVGRVQTPTLAMLVAREKAIQAFVPESYREVIATFSPADSRPEDGEAPARPTYQGTYFRGDSPTPEARRLPIRPSTDDVGGPDGDVQGANRGEDPVNKLDIPDADRIVARALAGDASIESIRPETRRMPPPLLYDLTELQRHANRLFGLSARDTLAIAQSLYETHKLISYPRTDSRHLSQDAAETLPEVIRAIRAPYEGLLAPGTGTSSLGARFVDDSQVTDHHAIIPTPRPARLAALPLGERRLYDLICRRLLAAWHKEHVWAVTNVVTTIKSRDPLPIVDRYHSSGTLVLGPGWKVLDLEPENASPKTKAADREARNDPGAASPADSQTLPSGLAIGQVQDVLDARAVDKKTRPPKRFTDATLLTAMETAGKTLDDRELSDAMKDNGLGTPATRAEIIETLLRRAYIVRSGKALEATPKGIRLIEVVHPLVKSPEMTGRWEAELRRIHRGEGRLADFMRQIEDYVREVVNSTFQAGGRSPSGAGSEPGPISPMSRVSPNVGADSDSNVSALARLPVLLKDTFGHAAFRPYQEAVCRAATEGRDVLLVMPTGAGKSLCYQLPGLARKGTTLVVSPLIALMEDQVGKLKALGLAAERIHSGRDRMASRIACRDYLDGRLDFLFIAPERLSVAGFPEMLAKRTPALVAIDEAHCISHWGHDFRPDYRLLGKRLPLLRPAPVIALTATATPRVQDDIAEQLGLVKEGRFIHGFRRTNIAVEAVAIPTGERADEVLAVLVDETRRPAIVYAPTRREAESLGEALSRLMPAAAYHAGMSAQARDRVQADFLAGRLSAIVATIAFGMGVDKPDVRTVIHTGLPASLEGYYQEIGRAGRDGKPSRAILLYSFADRRTHEFFHNRDYPEPAILERLFAELGKKPKNVEELAEAVVLERQVFEKALEKLVLHGGAVANEDGAFVKGATGWLRPYAKQRDHKLEQLDRMMRCAESPQCRMLQLVRHFGDQEDSGEPCGLCDICAPAGCVVQRLRTPSQSEDALIRRILDELRGRDGLSTGQLFRLTAPSDMERRAFEEVLGGLARARLLNIEDDEFEKDGRTIPFQRAFLTGEGHVGGLGAPIELWAKTKVRAKSRLPDLTRPKRRRKSAKPFGDARTIENGAGVAERLRAWRLAESRRMKVAAFQILTDRALANIANARPRTEGELAAVAGIGPVLLRKYGPGILRAVSG